MTVLQQRFLTALLLFSITVLGFYYIPEGFVAFIIGLGAWEWSRLSGLHSLPLRFVYVGLVLALFAYFILRFGMLALTLGVVGWLFALPLLFAFRYYKERTLNAYCSGFKAFIGVLVLVPCGVAVIQLNRWGGLNLVLLLLLVWSVDIAAYFAGKRWGKHKIAPNISPGKTWEGYVVGVAVAMLVALGGLQYLDIAPQRALAFAILVAISIMFAIVGDLFESTMKRMAHVKDSGRLLPGHGGVLDRIDSITAAAPVFALGLSYLLGS